jgi:hypothetical protein
MSRQPEAHRRATRAAIYLRAAHLHRPGFAWHVELLEQAERNARATLALLEMPVAGRGETVGAV